MLSYLLGSFSLLNHRVQAISLEVDSLLLFLRLSFFYADYISIWKWKFVFGTINSNYTISSRTYLAPPRLRASPVPMATLNFDLDFKRGREKGREKKEEEEMGGEKTKIEKKKKSQHRHRPPRPRSRPRRCWTWWKWTCSWSKRSSSFSSTSFSAWQKRGQPPPSLS